MSDDVSPPPAKRFSPPADSDEFYRECIAILADSHIPYLLSGTYALTCYTGIFRPTKDVDIFTTPSDALRILAKFQQRGFPVEMVDERWLARVLRGDLFLDVIFNMPTSGSTVTEEWFSAAPSSEIYGYHVNLVPPTEFVWSKIFIQDRYRYDGADVAHMILKKSTDINWKSLLNHMELYWEVLLIAILNFRFIYPSERDLVPRWLFDELRNRLEVQISMPAPSIKICRGRIYSPRDYGPDVAEWGFSEAFGNLEEQYGRH